MSNNTRVELGWFIGVAIFIFFMILAPGRECSDGWKSPSIGIMGACSHHGGVKSQAPYIIFALFFSAIVGILFVKSSANGNTNSTTTNNEKNDYSYNGDHQTTDKNKYIPVQDLSQDSTSQAIASINCNVDRPSLGVASERINKYTVVMFPMTGALAVCDLDIQDIHSGKIYAFAVKRKIMRMFCLNTWNAAIQIYDDRATHAIQQYIEWSKVGGLQNKHYQERIKVALSDQKTVNGVGPRQEID